MKFDQRPLDSNYLLGNNLLRPQELAKLRHLIRNKQHQQGRIYNLKTMQLPKIASKFQLDKAERLKLLKDRSFPVDKYLG